MDDESAAAMMAVLRYGSGFPWNRLEGLEENLGIPLPEATIRRAISSPDGPGMSRSRTARS